MKLSFPSEGEIMTFSDKQKLGEFVASGPALQKILKGVLWREGKRFEPENCISVKKVHLRMSK